MTTTMSDTDDWKRPYDAADDFSQEDFGHDEDDWSESEEGIG
jgi:hypothetical protein